jgi:hypothetical protein
MPEPARLGERLVRLRNGLLGIAEHGKGQRQPSPTRYARIVRQGGGRVPGRRAIERQQLLQVRSGGGELAESEQGCAERAMAEEAGRAVTPPLG